MSFQDKKGKLIALIEKADCIIYKNRKSSYPYGSIYRADGIEFNEFTNPTSFANEISRLKDAFIDYLISTTKSQKPDSAREIIELNISSFSELQKLFEVKGSGPTLEIMHRALKRDIKGDDPKYNPADLSDELSCALVEANILTDFNVSYFIPFFRKQYELLETLLSELYQIKSEIQIGKIVKSVRSAKRQAKSSTSGFSYSGKPIEDIENFLNETYLRITKDTSTKYITVSSGIFMDFFKGKPPKSKIRWYGRLNELHYLIDYINRSGYIKFPPNFWEFVCVHFVIGSNAIDQEKLKHSHRINSTDNNITSCLPE